MANNTRNLNKKISASLEDYLEVIHEILEEKQGVRAIDISKRLGVGRSSVTDALKALSYKNLVNYGRYDVISLTDEGRKFAQDVIEKHEVLYTFFTKIIGLSEQEADDNACRIEHVISDKAFEGLKKLLNRTPNDM